MKWKLLNTSCYKWLTVNTFAIPSRQKADAMPRFQNKLWNFPPKRAGESKLERSFYIRSHLVSADPISKVLAVQEGRVLFVCVWRSVCEIAVRACGVIATFEAFSIGVIKMMEDNGDLIHLRAR